MKLGSIILFALLTLFTALPVNPVWACGHDTDGIKNTHPTKERKSCCAKGEAQSPRAEDACGDHQNPAPGCPCDHERGNCHCPGCGISHTSAAFTLEYFPVFHVQPILVSMQKMAFYFADHLPEAVYLPIWQPPKIAA